MTVRTGVGWNAEDQKKGMTFVELRQIVQEAMKVDINDKAIVRAAVGWGGQVRTLRVEEVER